jgi:hypothetical protein
VASTNLYLQVSKFHKYFGFVQVQVAERVRHR